MRREPRHRCFSDKMLVQTAWQLVGGGEKERDQEGAEENRSRV